VRLAAWWQGAGGGRWRWWSQVERGRPAAPVRMQRATDGDGGWSCGHNAAAGAAAAVGAAAGVGELLHEAGED